jgi:transposase
MMTTTRLNESTAAVTLLLAFELGERVWKLGFTTGLGQRPRFRHVPAGAVDRVLEEIAHAKRRWQLSAETLVVSCYEAGRDGFWLHRYLVAHQVTNYVVDSASIEMNRRARRAKTDRLDLAGLLTLLARYSLGDRRGWRVVRVPSVADEDARQLHRSREAIQHDRTRLINRLKGLLTTQGLRIRLDDDFLARLDRGRLWDGSAIPAGLKERLTRIWSQLELLTAQLTEVDAAWHTMVANPATRTGRAAITLETLGGIGPIGAGVLATELFGWREIHNSRQLAALVGLAPAPFQSGETAHDQGITRAGNKHVRRIMVQLAWNWLRYQPTSALTRWYQQRFAAGGRRMRRIGIVALARKLLIAVWRYSDQGVIPDGAVVKATR